MAVWIVTIVCIQRVCVDSGKVRASGKKVKTNHDMTGGFVGDSGDIPIVVAAGLAGDNVIFADIASEWDSTFKISWDVLDELIEVRKTLFIDKWTVGSHGHAGIDGDEVGDLAGNSGGDTLDAVFNIENAIGIVHAAR